VKQRVFHGSETLAKRLIPDGLLKLCHPYSGVADELGTVNNARIAQRDPALNGNLAEVPIQRQQDAGSDSARSKSVCRTARERPSRKPIRSEKALPGLSAAAGLDNESSKTDGGSEHFQCLPRDVQRAEYPNPWSARSRSVGRRLLCRRCLRSRDRLLGATDRRSVLTQGRPRSLGGLPILPFPFDSSPVYSESLSGL